MHFEILGSKGPSSNPDSPTGPPAPLWLCSYRCSPSRGVHEMADHRRPPRPIYSALLCHVTCPAHPIRGGAGRDVRATNAARNRGYWERAPAVPSGGWGTRGGASSSPRARWSRRCRAPLGHSHEPLGSPPTPPLPPRLQLDKAAWTPPPLLASEGGCSGRLGSE